MCFGDDIQARQLERSSGGLQGQGYKIISSCAERLSLCRGGRDSFHADVCMTTSFAISKDTSSKGYVCWSVLRPSLCIQQPE